MKSKRLRRLQIGTIVVLFLYMLMVVYPLVVVLQHGKLFGVVTNLSQRWQNGASESGKTAQELQDDFRVFAQDFSNALQVQRDLLFDYFVVNVAMIGFLGWSTFMIFRIKREVDHDV